MPGLNKFCTLQCFGENVWNRVIEDLNLGSLETVFRVQVMGSVRYWTNDNNIPNIPDQRMFIFSYLYCFIGHISICILSANIGAFIHCLCHCFGVFVKLYREIRYIWRKTWKSLFEINYFTKTLTCYII